MVFAASLLLTCVTPGYMRSQRPGVPLAVGQWAELMRVWSGKDVDEYAAVGGDHNPLHLDAEYAATTRFGQRVVHGMLTAGLFGTTLATVVPGSVYVTQDLRFTAPVFLDVPVVARVEITHMERRMVDFATTAFALPRGSDALVEDAKDDVGEGGSAMDLVGGLANVVPVISGTARVMVPREAAGSGTR